MLYPTSLLLCSKHSRIFFSHSAHLHARHYPLRLESRLTSSLSQEDRPSSYAPACRAQSLGHASKEGRDMPCNAIDRYRLWLRRDEKPTHTHQAPIASPRLRLLTAVPTPAFLQARQHLVPDPANPTVARQIGRLVQRGPDVVLAELDRRLEEGWGKDVVEDCRRAFVGQRSRSAQESRGPGRGRIVEDGTH
jgi:hypothetical protein